MRDRDASLTAADLDALAWQKMDGLLPAIVQDYRSGAVLMLGYMNRDALARTLEIGLATFWSRSRNQLWTKGETSDNHLNVVAVHADCDADALRVLAEPHGPTCHLGTASCFGGGVTGPGWLADLSHIIADRAAGGANTSYTARLLAEGPQRIAQKVGEEGVEVALAAVASSPAECAGEVADLLYHVSVLMQAKGFSWNDVMSILQARHAAKGQQSD